jgi:hypothetical protein
MNTDGQPGKHFGLRALRALKWLLFGIEVLLVWVLCNTLFLVPIPFGAQQKLIAGAAALLSALAAWASGSISQTIATRQIRSAPGVLSTPPVAICIFVLSVVAVIKVISVFAGG